jgi:hypothetical protein
MAEPVLKTIADLLEQLLPLLHIATLGSALSSDLNAVQPVLKSDLQWTGDRGALIYVPIGEHPSTEQLTYNGIRVVGSGPSPKDAMAIGIERPSLDKAMPAYLSEEKSFYLWYDSTGLSWRIIPPPFAKQLRVEALEEYNDAALLRTIVEKRNNDIYLHAIDLLKSKELDAQTKLIVMNTAHNIEVSRAEMSRIVKNLNEALSKAEEVANFQATLKQIGLAIGVAQLAIKIADAIPDSGVTAGDSMEIIDQKLEDYKIENEKYIIHFRQQWELQKKLTTDEAAKLGPILRDNGAPPDVLNWKP